MGNKHHHNRFFSAQFLTSCLSTTLVLVLLGTIVLFVLTAQNLSRYVRENINVSVLVSDNIDSLSILQMKQDLEGKPYTKSVEYISQEQALETLNKEMGTDQSEFLDYNPLTASFEMKMNADFANNDSLTKITHELRQSDKVLDVIYEKELMQSVNSNIRKISIILLIIAAVFTYISFQLINNTVRLTIFSKRFSINTMKLVGASWGFIRRPFLQRAAILGIVSAVIADALIALGVQSLERFEPEIRTVVDNQVLIIVAASVLLFGLLITFLCTYFSLSRYLRMSSNELYHV